MSSQRDAERADIEKERLEQLKGPAAQVCLGARVAWGVGFLLL